MADADIKRMTVPFRVTDPERISSKRYYDEEFYQLENEKLWPHVWQMACRLEQIPNVGDYVEYSNLGKSVIVVRTKAGVKAYHNVCRHRGVALAESGEHGNCKTQGFICPFHGWRWDMDGKNTFVYGRHLFDERQLDQADIALKTCRVEEALGCAFINWDDDAPSFRDSIGPLVDRLDAHNVPKLRAEWWYSTTLPSNWKLAMEAFMEGYHVMRTHPQLQAANAVLYNSMYGQEPRSMAMADNQLSLRENIDAQLEHMELIHSGMGGMIARKEVEIARSLADVDVPGEPRDAILMWLGMVQDQITKRLGALGEPVPDLNAVAVSDPLAAVEFIFPHFFLLPFFSNMSSYRIRPNGPESCIFELWSLTFYPEGEEPEAVMEPIVLPYDSKEYPQIPQQDYSNIPRQQIGLHGGGFEFMRLGKHVEGLISNYHRVIDGYLGGNVPADRLAKAQHVLGGNFDGPIHDVGF